MYDIQTNITTRDLFLQRRDVSLEGKINIRFYVSYVSCDIIIIAAHKFMRLIYFYYLLVFTHRKFALFIYLNYLPKVAFEWIVDKLENE